MSVYTKFFDPRSVKVAVKNGTIWSKMLPWAYTSVVILGVVLLLGIFLPVVKRNQELIKQKTEMSRKLEMAKMFNSQLQKENRSLQNDPVYIERMARDVLNVGRHGETIFRFPEYRTQKTESELNR